MSGEVLRLVLIAGVIFGVMMAVRSFAQSRTRTAQALGPLVPSSASSDQSLAPVAVGLPPRVPPGLPAGLVPPTPPAADRSGVLRASREQAVLLRRHFPPREGSLSHWGGVPVVPRGFTWPFVVLPDGTDRALTFVLQVDCAAIPADGRLGLMPDRGQLYVFLDLDWGTHWIWSVRYEDGDAAGFVPARVPASLPRAYPQRGYWNWPQRDEDWPHLLPFWSIEPVLATAGDVPPPVDEKGDRSDEGDFWPGTIDIRGALDGIDDAVVPLHYYENRYDDDATLVRPYATYPHDWQAVRIVLGHLRGRHLDQVLARGDMSEEEAAAFVASLRTGTAEWTARAAAADPRSPVSREESEAVWQFLLDHQAVTRFALSNAVNDSLDATLAGNRLTAELLPPEALDYARSRHALATESPSGPRFSDTQRMLCPPSYVQGDAEERIGEWLLLLEMSADHPIGHHFGEGVYQFWIRPADLAARRFDLVELRASAY